MPTRILGISAYYHDSAACLVVDGRVVAAAQEERFTRKKHDASFPSRAVDYCLREAGITVAELDLVGFYEKPLVKFDAGNRWTTVELTARGPRMTARLNGTLTADAEDGKYARGPIALQAAGGLVRYRNLQIRELR